ncbi:MAG: SurA N-terminal domain-containing protein [Bacteroidetes bacterium]|nr:SurA N-terminal domain-containing protein [Bacteroidota bacterium]
MAVITRIRKRVGLLIGFVGVSMILFILGDVLTSNSGLLNGNSDVVGAIGGEKVHFQEYERRIETLTENYKINTKNETVDQNTQDMLREQAWGMFVTDNTLGKEYKNLDCLAVRVNCLTCVLVLILIRRSSRHLLIQKQIHLIRRML